MAWTTPGTATAGEVLTAAFWNANVRDNLVMGSPVYTNEAARDAAIPAPSEGMSVYLTASTVAAATGGVTAVPTGVRTVYNGSVWVCVTDVCAGSQTAASTTSGSYVTTLTGDATAVSVTLVTGTTAIVSVSSRPYNGTTSNVFLSFSVSGATTIAASDNNGASSSIVVNATYGQLARTQILTGLTAGTNTFTLNYKTTGGTLEYALRGLVVHGIA